MEIPKTMRAVVTLGQGGYDQLSYCTVPTPTPAPGEVLLQVLAAGVNNTEINTRLGWYSKRVTAATNAQAQTEEVDPTEKEDGGWDEKTPFPFIQGTDCCGRVVAIGVGADPSLLGQRVLVRPCMRGPEGFDSLTTRWMASDFDGAFAQFVAVPAGEVFPVTCEWTDVELASIPCAYGTSENMVQRAGVRAGDHVLVPGASGGVGSATVQLCKRRGARVTAICGADKADRVRALGADTVLTGRPGDAGWRAVCETIHQAADVVIDNVGGLGFPDMIRALTRGGRYATSGAVAGPIVELDMRTLYLRDLRLIGCTAWDETVFPDLVSYIERGEIVPLVARTFPLHDIVTAQATFLERKHVGKFVLIPPAV